MDAAPLLPHTGAQDTNPLPSPLTFLLNGFHQPQQKRGRDFRGGELLRQVREEPC